MVFKVKPDRITEIESDILAVFLDDTKKLFVPDDKQIEALIKKAAAGFKNKKIKKELFIPLGAECKAKYLLISWRGLIKHHDFPEALKIFAAKVLDYCRDYGLTSADFVLNVPAAAPLAGAVVEGVLLGSYSFNKYKKEKDDFYSDLKVGIVCDKTKYREVCSSVIRAQWLSEAINRCRECVDEPASQIYPQTLAGEAVRIAKKYGLDCTILDEKGLSRNGYNGLIAVGQGSIHPPRLITLRYSPRGKTKHRLAIVGKGITFDTGGISLKPSEKLDQMKGDMAGGAAVLFAMQAIAQSKPPLKVIGIIPAAENFPGPRAQCPGNILTAKNGKSVYVDNTDAEGRLVLIDGFARAEEEQATHIIDIATLTGSCMRALGTSVSGILGNDQRLIKAVIESGEVHGERYWELPLVQEYREELESPYADIKNIGGRNAGAITAALFLQEFIPSGIPWAHLDIAGTSVREKPWKYYCTGATGVGIKTFVELCQRFTKYFT